MREHHVELSSVTLTAQPPGTYDCVPLGADYDQFDFALIRRHTSLYANLRGRYLKPNRSIIKA